jgi:hypothetical protein
MSEHFELERMKNRVRDLMFITAGLFDNPIQHGIDVEEYLISAMQNILADKPLFDRQKRVQARLTDERYHGG